MTTGITAAIANAWLDADFATATSFIKLHIGDPGSAGATAPAVGDATRKQATMAAASGGSKAMTSMASVWTNVTTTETLSHISWWSAAAAGTFKASAALTATQPWVNTNTFTLTVLTIAITPLAA
jgi:hypothetical protein